MLTSSLFYLSCTHQWVTLLGFFGHIGFFYKILLFSPHIALFAKVSRRIKQKSPSRFRD
jgi:hypothetical protein